IALFAMARRAAPLRLAWTGAFAGAAAASMAALAVQIACPLDDVGHAFLGHFVPVLVIAVLGISSRRVLVRRTVV
ncbi:MAG TPA: NrsF family protein, partial [Vicinamibacterales bacterium]